MATVWVSALIGVVASVEDVSRRRISNWIPLAACLAGLWLQIAEHGWHGLLTSLLGVLTGGAVFLIFYLLGGMGGGDIKLMAGFGSILGATGILEAALWTAACGGIFAMVVIGVNALRRAWSNRRSRRAAGHENTPVSAFQLSGEEVDSIPYAPAIAAGVWLSLVGKV